MNERLGLYLLAQTHRLDRAATLRLLALGNPEPEPAQARQRIWQAAAVLAAGLVGLGLVLWVAANWEDLGRMGRFALLQGVVLCMGLGAAASVPKRVPLALLALLATGALFAYFGQTYQTGADAWQLFALWAALSFPLALAARHDAVWMPWALVSATAIGLWLRTYSGHSWRILPGDLQVHVIAWLALGCLCGLLSARLSPLTGAGLWSRRLAWMLASIAVTLSALGGLLQAPITALYPLGLLLLAAVAISLSRPQFFEVFGLSAAAMGLNVLLLGGLVRLLFKDHRGDIVPPLMLTGLAAAGLLAASVQWILRSARAHAAQELA